MKDDIRYTELLFLQDVDRRAFQCFNPQDEKQRHGLRTDLFRDMAITLAEDSYIRFDNNELQLLVSRLRNELSAQHPLPTSLAEYQWAHPRRAIDDILSGQQVYPVQMTYRGLRRIEDLREILRRERILEPFEVLLDLRYFHKDLEDELRRGDETVVSVLRTDMDGFKRINDEFGHAAGDVVMKTYLEAVRDGLGLFGTAYRGRGDEVLAIVVGQSHEKATQLAENIRERIEAFRCEHKGIALPKVTASIGVASTPPAVRDMNIENLADVRQQRAKKEGKNKVVKL